MTTSPASASRVVFGAAVLAVPLIGLALVLARPDLDLRWEHHPAHFWLVLGTAIVSAVLAYATGEAAARRGDARLFYVSLAFLSSAGFLALHALATPGVVLGRATPDSRSPHPWVLPLAQPSPPGRLPISPARAPFATSASLGSFGLPSSA